MQSTADMSLAVAAGGFDRTDIHGGPTTLRFSGITTCVEIFGTNGMHHPAMRRHRQPYCQQHQDDPPGIAHLETQRNLRGKTRKREIPTVRTLFRMGSRNGDTPILFLRVCRRIFLT